jgi:hypothetical protein
MRRCRRLVRLEVRDDTAARRGRNDPGTPGRLLAGAHELVRQSTSQPHGDAVAVTVLNHGIAHSFGSTFARSRPSGRDRGRRRT